MSEFPDLKIGGRRTAARLLFSIAVTAIVGLAAYASIRWLSHLQ
jgi:hypothetical protein